jgi:uncharacterized protein YqjF (DUF2071 family)
MTAGTRCASTCRPTCGRDTKTMAGANPEERVTWPFAYQSWRALTFLHWAYNPADVQRLLPAGLDGLWFFSLDVSGLATVLGTRAALWLPYHWAEMTVETGSTITYRSRRRWPPTAGHEIVVEPGSPLSAAEIDARDHFLTGRWRAFTSIAGRLVTVPVEHQVWPLWRVQVHQLHEDLLVAAGLPAPAGPPVAHYSPGVDARFGLPRWGGG